MPGETGLAGIVSERDGAWRTVIGPLRDSFEKHRPVVEMPACAMARVPVVVSVSSQDAPTGAIWDHLMFSEPETSAHLAGL